jgi:GH35 family endo-1,4-beta-xylanase
VPHPTKEGPFQAILNNLSSIAYQLRSFSVNMGKYFIWFLVLIAFLLPPDGLRTEAQSDEPRTLRHLAAENSLYIGSAAWTSHLADPIHAEIMAREFNMFTPEHEAKFCMLSRSANQYDFSRFDRLVDFAEDNNMVIHGHALIWHSCSPSWVEGANWSRDEAIDVLRKHIYTVVGRYKGRIKYWDVVNEAWGDDLALRDTAWTRMIGEDYIELAFQFAHEADPNALLLYNDYGAEPMNGKSNAIYGMAQDFVERGIPIHGIGMQAHLVLDTINFRAIARNIERFNTLGLEVQFTEVDIRYSGETTEAILRRQAQDYADLMQTCLDASNCTAFIVWGVSDKFTWLREASFVNNPTVQPLLFSDTYEAKPAYSALVELLASRVS